MPAQPAQSPVRESRTAEPADDAFTAVAARARAAATTLATCPRETKDAALCAMADLLESGADEVVEANVGDVGAAERARVPTAVLDRLRLDHGRVAAMADGLRGLAALPDPVGEVVRERTLDSGLRMAQIRVPLGVVGIVYEARPNVTTDVAGICLKSGNAALLRGSSSAERSNTAIVGLLREAAVSAGLPADVVGMVPGHGHGAVRQLLRARGLVDVVVPRGGAELIDSVVCEATVPVIETGVGNCHVYVDAAADLDMGREIVLNAKTQRPSVCNAAESLLVHAEVADRFLPMTLSALGDAGVTVHGDQRVRALDADVVPASEDDYAAEYLSLDISVAVVDSLEEAVEHIRTYGTGHTEAIVSSSRGAVDRFVAEVDAAAVVVNASTRFTDGGEFGFGAEIGISTQKLHARGPMGLPEMTTTKYVLTGTGQVRT